MQSRRDRSRTPRTTTNLNNTTTNDATSDNNSSSAASSQNSAAAAYHRAGTLSLQPRSFEDKQMERVTNKLMAFDKMLKLDML